MTGGRGLDTERWKQIESVLDEVLDLEDSAEASSVLQAPCGGGSELRQEIAIKLMPRGI